MESLDIKKKNKLEAIQKVYNLGSLKNLGL